MSDSDFPPEFGSPYQVLVDHCEEGDIKFLAERRRLISQRLNAYLQVQ